MVNHVLKGRRDIGNAVCTCGEVITAEKPEGPVGLDSIAFQSAVRDIPGFSHRHVERGAVVTLWPKCYFLHHPKKGRPATPSVIAAGMLLCL